MSLIQKLLGQAPARINRLDVKFGTDANYFGEHGKIVVTNKKLGLEEATVPFVFVGLTTPLPMDPDTMNYIWDQAEQQGYIPIRITQYGRMNERPYVQFQSELQVPDANDVPTIHRDTRAIVAGNALVQQERLPGVSLHSERQPELIDGVFRSGRAVPQTA